MAWSPNRPGGMYYAGGGCGGGTISLAPSYGASYGAPPQMHPVERLAFLEAEVERLKGTVVPVVQAVPAAAIHELPNSPSNAGTAPAAGGPSREEFMSLMTAHTELAKAHAQLLKSHADVLSSFTLSGSGALAAARLRPPVADGKPPAADDPLAVEHPCDSDGTPIAIIPVRDSAISNRSSGAPPEAPTLMDNTLLFLPERAVVELGLEPNMDDKGDDYKELWFGRVWELRSLLAAKYRRKMSKVATKQAELTYLEKRELAQKLNDPAIKQRIIRLQAQWKGAAYRMRSSLAVLDRLKLCNLRGNLIYAHGSGGCSWDNFRICRMISRLGVVVIAPDGFAYPANTAMGQLRHKDLQPLKQARDDVDYWTGDLMYSSSASGSANYSTKADKVLENPKDFCDLYERCYQLRRSELHFTIKGLPQFMKTKGFFLGGTSEGAMTIARFDDQRYGEMVLGRFINSFSIEYCYFTPTPQAGEIGGQTDVPTLNIIGTRDQYFGPVDSVAKIVASDAKGYGNKDLTGNGYKTMVRQGIEVGLVCVLEDGVHSPCNTHDNFLRMLFDVFFTRPGAIWELDAIWNEDDSMKDIVQVQQSCVEHAVKANVVQVFVPKSKYPNKWSLRQVEASSRLTSHKAKQQMQEQLRKEAAEHKKHTTQINAMLDGVRKNTADVTPDATTQTSSFYDGDKLHSLKLLKKKVTGLL